MSYGILAKRTFILAPLLLLPCFHIIKLQTITLILSLGGTEIEKGPNTQN